MTKIYFVSPSHAQCVIFRCRGKNRNVKEHLLIILDFFFQKCFHKDLFSFTYYLFSLFVKEEDKLRLFILIYLIGTDF